MVRSPGNNGPRSPYRKRQTNDRSRRSITAIIVICIFIVMFKHPSEQNKHPSKQNVALNKTPPKDSTTPAAAAAETPPKEIPHNVWFVGRHKNILETKEPKLIYKNLQNTISRYRDAFSKVRSVPSPRFEFLTRPSCHDKINELGTTYPHLSTLSHKLLLHYETSQDGSDICRLAVLYLHGGYYLGTDLEVAQPLVSESFDRRFQTRPIKDETSGVFEEGWDWAAEQELAESSWDSHHAESWESQHFRQGGPYEQDVVASGAGGNAGEVLSRHLDFVGIRHPTRDEYVASFIGCAAQHDIIEMAMRLMLSLYDGGIGDGENILNRALYNAYTAVTGVAPVDVDNYNYEVNVYRDKDDDKNMEKAYYRSFLLIERWIVSPLRHFSKHSPCNKVIQDEIFGSTTLYFYSHTFGSEDCPAETFRSKVSAFFYEDIDATCGNGQRGNGRCRDRKHCCSTQGWCGDSPQHCQDAEGYELSNLKYTPYWLRGEIGKVKNEYGGKRNDYFSPRDGTCGGGNRGNGLCPNRDDCCSEWGWCMQASPCYTNAFEDSFWLIFKDFVKLLLGMEVTPRHQNDIDYFSFKPCGYGEVGTGVCEKPDECCSVWGFCGKGVGFCFPDGGTCGFGNVGNGQCPNSNECCSKGGWCGTGESFCEDAKTDSGPPCGNGIRGNGKCPNKGDCCSSWGFCGNTTEFCILW